MTPGPSGIVGGISFTEPAVPLNEGTGATAVDIAMAHRKFVALRVKKADERKRQQKATGEARALPPSQTPSAQK